MQHRFPGARALVGRSVCSWVCALPLLNSGCAERSAGECHESATSGIYVELRGVNANGTAWQVAVHNNGPDGAVNLARLQASDRQGRPLRLVVPDAPACLQPGYTAVVQVAAATGTLPPPEFELQRAGQIGVGWVHSQAARARMEQGAVDWTHVPPSALEAATFSPPELEARSVLSGSCSPSGVWVVNTRPYREELEFELVGDEAQPVWSLLQPAMGHLSLGAYEQRFVSLNFCPLQATAQRATLVAHGSDGALVAELPLRGRGLLNCDARPSVAPEELDFGPIEAGSTHTRTLRLDACVSADRRRNFSWMTVVGPDAAAFKVQPQLDGAQEIAGQSQTVIGVEVAGHRPGSLNATLTLNPGGDDAPMEVPLHATVLPAEVGPHVLVWCAGRQVTDTAGGTVELPLFELSTCTASCDEIPCTAFAWRALESAGAQDALVVPTATGTAQVSPPTWGDMILEVDGMSRDGDWASASGYAAQVRVRGASTSGRQAVLTWTSARGVSGFPGEGADLDLHLLRGGACFGDSVLDCSVGNPAPDWVAGGPGPLGPQLEHASEIGGVDAGEVVGWSNDLFKDIDSLELGVHYAADHGYGSTVATLLTRDGSELVSRTQRVLSPGDWWVAAHITGTYELLDGNVTQGLPGCY